MWDLLRNFFVRKTYIVYPQVMDLKSYERALNVVAAAKDLVFELNRDTYHDIPLPDELEFLMATIEEFEDSHS